MNTPKRSPTATITYPDGLSEWKLSCILQYIIAGVDRSRLCSDKRLSQPHDSLLLEHVDGNVLLNIKIHNMVISIVTALMTSNQQEVESIENILLDAARDPQLFRQNLNAFKAAIAGLVSSNGTDSAEQIGSLVSGQLHKKLTIMSAADQDAILNPPVSPETLLHSLDKTLHALQECRGALMEALAQIPDSDAQPAGEPEYYI